MTANKSRDDIVDFVKRTFPDADPERFADALLAIVRAPKHDWKREDATASVMIYRLKEGRRGTTNDVTVRIENGAGSSNDLSEIANAVMLGLSSLAEKGVDEEAHLISELAPPPTPPAAPEGRCPKCGVDLEPGIATGHTFVSGMRDFPSDGPGHLSTMSAGGPGLIISCMKCPSCGFSVT